MDRHGNGSNSKKHSPRTARHDASGWHDPMVGPGLGRTLDTVARHGHVTIFGWSARRHVNSPQIRRISTKENPNSLLLPLPQTPPPPSLPPSLPREHLSRAPPSLILVAPFPPTPRQAPAQPPPLPPSLNPRHARRRPCDGRIQAPP
jgi:hypothetical protein